MLDFGCQVNLAKGSALPHFYWESTLDCGSSIQGTPVPLVAKSENFPIKLKGTSDTLTLYRLDDINEDCIPGSEFLSRVHLISVDTKKMIFSCVSNDCKIDICMLCYNDIFSIFIKQCNPIFPSYKLNGGCKKHDSCRSSVLYKYHIVV